MIDLERYPLDFVNFLKENEHWIANGDRFIQLRTIFTIVFGRTAIKHKPKDNFDGDQG